MENGTGRENEAENGTEKEMVGNEIITVKHLFNYDKNSTIYLTCFCLTLILEGEIFFIHILRLISSICSRPSYIAIRQNYQYIDPRNKKKIQKLINP